MRHIISASAVLLVCGAALGQVGVKAPVGPQPKPAVHAAVQPRAKYWVFFADKGVGPGAIDGAIRSLESTYDPRATERRRLRRTAPGLFDARDLPVAAAYRDAVAAAGAALCVESRWLNAVSVRATPAQLARIRSLACVRSVTPVRAGRRCDVFDVTEDIPGPGGFAERDFYGLASAQLNQMNLPALHQRGYTGAGIIIGILDTGFRTDHDAFHTPGHPLVVLAAHDFINNDDSVGIDPGDDPEQHRHGTWILSTIGAYEPNQLVGGAYDASFVLCKTEDVTSETPIEEDNYVAGLEFIEQHGADMATSSLGYIDWYSQSDLDGMTATTTIAVNTATQNGLICVTAAGNEGHDDNPATSSLLAPADAFEVLAIGAVDDSGTIAGFSSSGPSADGRVKPEILARGVNTQVISSLNTTDFGAVSGTSLSTPLVASAVGCLIQMHPNWTPAQMRAAILGTASDFAANHTFDPLYVRGYGIINANAAADAFCPSDFNFSGGVPDDADIAAFFAAWNAGDASADFNNSGGTPDDADVSAFFTAWNAGC